MEIQKPEAVQIVKKYQADPCSFLTEVLDVKPEHLWYKMRLILESIRDNKKTAVKAGHSVSKSFTAGRAALWFLYNFFPATVITTAPSHPQVEEILWREIRHAHANAKVPLGGHVTKTKIELAEKWFAYGFATKPDTVTQEATRMQGYHNENLLLILDEAPGILPQIWDSAMTLLSSGNARLLVIGNPTMATGDFADCFKDPTFNKITIAVPDTPNYKEDREVIPGLSGREYEADVIRKYGKDSNYYKARVGGQIPDTDIYALIPLSWIERAENRMTAKTYKVRKRFITVDVADGGDDNHVIKAWENKTQIDELVIPDKKVEELEPHVWRMLRKIDGNAIVWDNDGIGRVLGGLLRASADKNTTLIPFEGSSQQVNEPADFEYRYSEGHWAMRKDFENDEICIFKNEEQREEIASVKLVDHRKGFITIEQKKFLKKRIGRSPDHKDAVMMMSACYDEVPAHSKTADSSYKDWANSQQTSHMAA